MKSRSLALVLALAAVIGSAPPSAAAATGGVPVSQEAAMYPKAVRLAHSGAANGRLLLTTTGFPSGGPVGAISESVDGGITYRRVGAVADETAKTGLCCTTLFELPQRIGSLEPGTLLWAGSTGQDGADRRMSLRVWRSTDVGRTWSLLSTAVRASGTGGLWEPEFSVDAAGRLVLHYADEGLPGRSQMLARVSSTDGVTWAQRTTTVAGTAAGHRPGMPSVRRLPGGAYLMAYEVCGFGGAALDLAAGRLPGGQRPLPRRPQRRDRRRNPVADLGLQRAAAAALAAPPGRHPAQPAVRPLPGLTERRDRQRHPAAALGLQRLPRATPHPCLIGALPLRSPPCSGASPPSRPP
ncbi:sialidase family protein [Umezawaea sp. Da 62-37]|nr:sialidase family protein [Umezawaea sp. Da 62-37]WNV87559.1 sialidase family protein [Umezawaea sp. Da 62-37]